MRGRGHGSNAARNTSRGHARAWTSRMAQWSFAVGSARGSHSRCSVAYWVLYGFARAVQNHGRRALIGRRGHYTRGHETKYVPGVPVGPYKVLGHAGTGTNPPVVLQCAHGSVITRPLWTLNNVSKVKHCACRLPGIQRAQALVREAKKRKARQLTCDPPRCVLSSCQ